MGTIKTKDSLGDVIFSKTQRQVLGLLFSNPNRSYYAREIMRFAEMGVGAVQRELEKLTQVGLLNVAMVGNQKHYQANTASPIFNELRAIILKTFGLADVLHQSLVTKAEQITVAFIFGSIAKGTDSASSDIDIMIIAQDVSYSEVVSLFTEAEGKLGRTINPTIYKPKEFLRKLTDGNAFIQRVIAQQKIFLIGSEDDIPKL